MSLNSYSKTDIGLLLLRVLASATMISHGLAKLGAFSELSSSFPDPLHIGSFLSLSATIGAEVFCAGLVLLGIGTRIFSVPVLITMLVAFFVIHGQDPFKVKELAYLYGVVYLALSFTGGGAISLGKKIPKLAKYS